jgi:hypothetical protein
MEALKNPAISAALLQFGINMMQPSPGGFVSQLGRAVGGGAEAAGRYGQARTAEHQASQKLATEQNQQSVENQYRQATLAETQRSNRSSENARQGALALENKKLGLQQMFARKGQTTDVQREARYFAMLKSLAGEKARNWSDPSGDPYAMPPDFMLDPELQQQAYQLSQTFPPQGATPGPQVSAQVSGTQGGLGTPAGKGDVPSAGALPVQEPMATKTGTPAIQLPAGYTAETLVNEARAAVKAGKDPKAVNNYLAQFGLSL